MTEDTVSLKEAADEAGRLADRLSPRGHLFLGDAEGTGGSERLRLVAPSVYTVAGSGRGDDPGGTQEASQRQR